MLLKAGCSVPQELDLSCQLSTKVPWQLVGSFMGPVVLDSHVHGGSIRTLFHFTSTDPHLYAYKGWERANWSALLKCVPWCVKDGVLPRRTPFRFILPAFCGQLREILSSLTTEQELSFHKILDSLRHIAVNLLPKNWSNLFIPTPH